MTSSILAVTLCAWPACRALAWDAPYAIRPDAEVTPRLSVGGSGTIPVVCDPAEVSSIAFALTGGVDYLDDDKFAIFDLIRATGGSTFRGSRGRFEGGGEAHFSLFDLQTQLRVLPRLHLLYGAALLREGVLTHTSSAGLSLHLGVVLPLMGDLESMRSYRRGYLQAEARPLVASFLAFLDADGLRDLEGLTAQAAGEVAFSGRVETEGGVVDGEVLMTASYAHLRSMFLVVETRYRSPYLWGWVAPFVDARYVVPVTPSCARQSDDAARLLHDQHLSVQAGAVIRLEDPAASPTG